MTNRSYACGEKNGSPRKKRRRKINRTLLTMWGVSSVLVVGLIIVGILMFTLKPGEGSSHSYISSTSTFFDGITVNGRDMSGLTYSEAWDVLSGDVNSALSGVSITVRVGTKSWLLSAADLGVSSTLEETLNTAMAYGRGDTTVNNARAQADLKEHGLNLSVSYKVNDAKLSNTISAISDAVSVKPVNASACPDTNSSTPAFIYSEGVSGMTLNEQKICEDISRLISDGALCSTVAPEFEYTEPTVTVDDLKAVTQLRSSFKTSYGENSTLKNANRIRNIQKSADILNGCTMEVGQEISFNEFIGPRYEKDGWALAPGIVNGSHYENQPGGGICQVSTTLYNALLCSGPEMEITQRKKHTWPSSYVDYGLDATVSTGGPDLCWKNNTESTVYIFAYADNVNYIMTVYIYGMPLPDGITYQVKGVVNEEIPYGDTEYEYIPTWPQGYEKTARNARKGYKTTSYRYKLKDGVVIETETLYSDYYRPISKLVQVGSGSPSLPRP